MAGEVSSARLWFPVLAAPAAWALQGLTGWFVDSLACPQEPAEGTLLAVGTARWIVALASAGALAVVVIALLTSILNWRTLAAASDGTVHERREYVSVLAVAATTILAIALVWAGLPPLLTRGCGVAR